MVVGSWLLVVGRRPFVSFGRWLLAVGVRELVAAARCSRRDGTAREDSRAAATPLRAQRSFRFASSSPPCAPRASHAPPRACRRSGTRGRSCAPAGLVETLERGSDAARVRASGEIRRDARQGIGRDPTRRASGRREISDAARVRASGVGLFHWGVRLFAATRAGRMGRDARRVPSAWPSQRSVRSPNRSSPRDGTCEDGV